MSTSLEYFVDKIILLKQQLENTYTFILDIYYGGSIESYILNTTPRNINTYIVDVFGEIITYMSAVDTILNKIQDVDFVKKEQLLTINKISEDYSKIINSFQYANFLEKYV